MTPEHKNIPDWAGRERQADLAWVADNLDVFGTTAVLAFVHMGRGALFVDTTIQLAPDAGHPFGYLSQEQVEEVADDDTRRMVKEYNPSQEFVIALLKPGDRISTYRICVVPPEDQGAVSNEPPPGFNGEPSDIETLMGWEAEGGCEAACPYHCWVEPDGVCPHGNPSWLLKLGLI
jgi:hypothetical protein